MPNAFQSYFCQLAAGKFPIANCQLPITNWCQMLFKVDCQRLFLQVGSRQVEVSAKQVISSTCQREWSQCTKFTWNQTNIFTRWEKISDGWILSPHSSAQKTCNSFEWKLVKLFGWFVFEGLHFCRVSTLRRSPWEITWSGFRAIKQVLTLGSSWYYL